MAERELPEPLKRRFKVDTVDEMWRKNLTQGNVRMRRYRHLYGMLPADPRCVNCHRPFAGFGGLLVRLLQGVERSPKNPRYCVGCHSFTSRFPGGAEIVLTMLFVDVRGSTTIAESMDARRFGKLMNRFYATAIRILVQADAFIDKLVGDEVTALFIPGFAGQEHARRAVQAGRELLRATGHDDPGGPWVPVGVGVHTGPAWVGSIAGASGEAADFTALGDSVNIAARLASEAGAGEALISEAAYGAAGLLLPGLERRQLALKGKREVIAARVLRSKAAPA
jgi:adenylate cyclase